MIFQTLSYTSVAGVTIALGDTTYPAQDFTMDVYQINDAVKKVQFPGRWATFSYPEYREINVAGEILGDSASDYNTKASAMRSAIQVPYKTQTARRHGTLSMTFFGDGNTYSAYVILSSLKTPVTAQYPSVGSYSVSWIAFEPYLWVTTSTNFSLAY